MEEEKISVIVPAYNLEKYLEKAVESIRAQSYQNLEIILVDDGSTDKTLQIMEEQQKKDARIKVIHKENGGVTSARMAGVEASTGEWIGFVDGDDWIEPNMYEYLHSNAKKYKADISHCGYKNILGKREVLYYGTGLLAEQDKLTGLKDLLAGSRIEPGLWNKLFHKTLFHSLLHEGLMDYSIILNEDLLMNFYLFREAKKSVYSDVCCYYYISRKHSAITEGFNIKRFGDPLKVTNIILKETESEPVLQRIMMRKKIRQLIGLSTYSDKAHTAVTLPYCRAARRELRQEIPQFLKGEYNFKLKVMAMWAAIWPWSFGAVHSLYARITGLDKKYAIEE